VCSSDLCKECKNYNTKWSCPPYTFDTTAKIAPYKNTYIIGTKIAFTNELLNSTIAVPEKNAILMDAIKQVRKKLDAFMLEQEQKYSGFVFFAGSCRKCEPTDCTRQSGTPCRYLGKIRPSLEAYGFDIGKTTANLLGLELKWGTAQNIPEYLVLVGALLTNEDVSMSLCDLHL
jgi:predicted metal-binding protein